MIHKQWEPADLAFSVEVLEDVKVGDRVKIRTDDGRVTPLYEAMKVDGMRVWFRLASLVDRERIHLN